MATIPEYEQHVGDEAVGQPTPQLSAPSQGSSGLDITEAASRLGTSVEHAGNAIGAHLAYMERQENQKKGYDISAQYARAGQLFLQGDGTEENPGLLNLRGNDAHDAIAKFQEWDTKQRKNLLEKSSLPADVMKSVERQIDSHGTVFFDNALHHQRTETEAAQEHSAVAAMGAKSDTLSLPNTTAKQMIDGIKDVQAIDAGRLHNQGQDDVVKTANGQVAAASVVKNFIDANPHMDPQAQQDMLDAVNKAGLLHPASVAKLQAPIDGKWTDWRTKAIQDHIVSDISGANGSNQFLNEQGFYDIPKVQKYATEISKGQPGKKGYFSGEENYQAAKAKEFAVMANGAIKDHREDAAKGFLDMIAAAKLKDPKANYQDVEQAALTQFGGSIQPSALEKLKDSAAKTWLGDPDGPKMRLNLMLSNPDLKRGYLDAKTLIDTTYSSHADAEKKRLAIQHLDEMAPTMKSGKSIHDWQLDQLAKVKTAGPFASIFGIGKVRQTEEEDVLRGVLGDQEQLDNARAAYTKKLGRTPTFAEMHSKVMELKRIRDAYRAEKMNGE